MKTHKLRDDALLELVRHEDETRTHYHFMLMNQTLGGKSSRRSFSRDACIALQDMAGKEFSSMDIHRGKPKEQRVLDGEPLHKHIHRSVKKLHEDLPHEIAEAESDLERARLMFENIGIEQDEAERHIKEAQGKLDRLKGVNEGLAKRADELTSKATASEGKLSLLESDKAAAIQATEQAKEALSHTNKQIESLEEKLGVTPIKLEPECVEVVTHAGMLSTQTEERDMYEASDVKKHIREQEIKADIAVDDAYRYKAQANRLENIRVDRDLTLDRNEELIQRLDSTKSDLLSAQAQIKLLKDIAQNSGVDVEKELLKHKASLNNLDDDHRHR